MNPKITLTVVTAAILSIFFLFFCGLVKSAKADTKTVSQEFNTNKDNSNTNVLNGRPSLCLYKPVADKVADRDSKFDKLQELADQRSIYIKKLETELKETQTLVTAFKLDVIALENRDKLRQEYENKMFGLYTKSKDEESKRWSRSTYFWLGNLTGTIQGILSSYVYSRIGGN